MAFRWIDNNMKKLKVVHVLNTGAYSGAENVVINIINNTREWIDATYISLEGSIREVLAEKDVDFYPLVQMRPSVLRKAIKELNPDIIHAHDYTTAIMIRLAKVDKPVINHLHNNSPWLGRVCLKSIVYYWAARKIDYFLTVSESVMDEYIFSKKLMDRVLVVGNPFDIKKIRFEASKQEIDLDIDVIALGRLTEQKNPLKFVEIINEVKKSIPNISAVMVGDGEQRELVSRRINELGLEKNVLLLGFKKNPYVYLAKAKVLCMPSSWEGFGLAAVEGLALGKPIVNSGVGGLKSFTNDKCGKICDSVDEYAEEIISLLTDESYYSKKSVEAIRTAEELSNMDEYCREIVSVYKKILEGKR